MSRDPTQNDVDSAIYSVAQAELRGKPVGSVVMVNDCIGYKVMGFWWTFRVHGLRIAAREWWERQKYKLRRADRGEGKQG